MSLCRTEFAVFFLLRPTKLAQKRFTCVLVCVCVLSYISILAPVPRMKARRTVH